MKTSSAPPPPRLLCPRGSARADRGTPVAGKWLRRARASLLVRFANSGCSPLYQSLEAVGQDSPAPCPHDPFTLLRETKEKLVKAQINQRTARRVGGFGGDKKGQ